MKPQRFWYSCEKKTKNGELPWNSSVNTPKKSTHLATPSVTTRRQRSDSSRRNASGDNLCRAGAFGEGNGGGSLFLFFFLTGCNPRLQTRQYTDAPKYNPHYTPCHCGLADTGGIKKTEVATRNRRKMCHERT